MRAPAYLRYSMYYSSQRDLTFSYMGRCPKLLHLCISQVDRSKGNWWVSA